MIKKILRKKSVVNNKSDLVKIESIKKFPVFMGVTHNSASEDLKCDMNFYISKSSGIVQLNPVLPFNVIYKEGHNSGLIGSLWKKHHKSFSDFIKKYNPKAVLEIGGGHGVLSKIYQAEKKIPWTIIEPNPSPIKGCKAKFIRAFFSKKIVDQINFDTLVHSHVLEHVYYPKQFLLNISNSMTKGKKMIFSVPNLEEMIKRNYTNAMNFEHTLFMNEEFIEYFLNLFSYQVVEKKYFEKDHSIFYCAEKKNKMLIKNKINSYKKNKKLFTNYFFYQKKIARKINLQISKYKSKNIFLFGAHVFSQYLLNFGVKEKNIYGLLDNDKFKQNKRLYGTNLRVYSPNLLKNVNKPVVILKAGVYNSEIKKQIMLINSAAKFI